MKNLEVLGKLDSCLYYKLPQWKEWRSRFDEENFCIYIFRSMTLIQSLFKIKKHYINVVLLFYIESPNFFFFDYKKKLLRKQISTPAYYLRN